MPPMTRPSVVAGRIRCLRMSQNALQFPSINASTRKMFVCVSSVAWVNGLAWSEVGNTPRYEPKKSWARNPRKNTGIA